MDIIEKKEIIVDCYSKTFDKQMAYNKSGVTELEITELELDKEFQSRLELFLIEEKEDLIRELKSFKTSLDDRVKFKAIIELGKYLYPARFVDPPKEFNHTIKDNRDPKELEEEKKEKERVQEEYEFLLEGKKVILDGESNTD